MYQYGELPPIDPEKMKELNERLYDEDPKVCKAARDALDQREEKLALALGRRCVEGNPTFCRREE